MKGTRDMERQNLKQMEKIVTQMGFTGGIVLHKNNSCLPNSPKYRKLDITKAGCDCLLHLLDEKARLEKELSRMKEASRLLAALVNECPEAITRLREDIAAHPDLGEGDFIGVQFA
jgi:hypothetical protein